MKPDINKNPFKVDLISYAAFTYAGLQLIFFYPKILDDNCDKGSRFFDQYEWQFSIAFFCGLFIILQLISLAFLFGKYAKNKNNKKINLIKDFSIFRVLVLIIAIISIFAISVYVFFNTF